MLLHEESESAWIDVAAARTHHESLNRGESHRCIHTLSAIYGSDAAAITHVAGDDFLLLGVNAEELAHASRHIAVACAVESVATHAVFAIIFVGKCIHICLCRHCLVESSVEHCHLWHTGQHSRDGIDSCHIHGIVERSNAVALLDHCNHLVGDEHTLVELLSAMHHAVTHGINFAEALDATKLGTGENVENRLDCAVVVADVQLNDFLAAVGELKLDKSVGKTDFLHATLGEHLVCLDLD